MQTVFADSALSESISDYDKELIVRYFKCSCFGIILDWIGSGIQDEYIEGMNRTLTKSKGVAEFIINNFAESGEVGEI